LPPYQDSQLVISTQLSEKELLEVRAFIAGFPLVSIYQQPDWVSIYQEERPYHFALLRNNDKQLTAFAAYRVYMGSASLMLGPLAHDADSFTACIRLLAKAEKKGGLSVLTLQLPEHISLSQPEHLQLGFEARGLAPGDTWATHRINLQQALETWPASFSENHRRSLKKAIKAGCVVKRMDDAAAFISLAKLYDKMYQARHLDREFANTEKLFEGIFQHMQKHGGFGLGVYLEEQMIGGILLAHEGQQLIYQYGASDPELRQIPILHAAFYEAIVQSKAAGYLFLDLGGYNPHAAEGDQVYEINRFKAGFGGSLYSFPQKFELVLHPIKDMLISSLKKVYRVFKGRFKP